MRCSIVDSSQSSRRGAADRCQRRRTGIAGKATTVSRSPVAATAITKVTVVQGGGAHVAAVILSPIWGVYHVAAAGHLYAFNCAADVLS